MIAYFDAFSGASGDMILGAFVDAGWTGLEDALSQLRVPGWKLESKKAIKRGIAATKVDFVLEPATEHRNLAAMLSIIAASGLAAPVQDSACVIFQRLAAVEAGIHGLDVQDVRFHELGGLDTLLDIVGACAGFAHFAFSSVAVSPLAVGSGTVKTQHGILPVPAPATAKLLEGWSITPGSGERELTTPTGAAILTHFATSQALPPMRISRLAYGAGSREADTPNVLRLLIGEAAGAQPAETVVVIETTIDDMSPELLPVAVDEVLAAGARDAYLTPILGKKGRPASLLTVLAIPGDEQPIMDAILRHTSTIGLRFRTEQRRVLPRHEITVQTDYGEVRVKISGEGATAKAKPEFEDCRRLASAAGVPVGTVHQAALRKL